jgi:hypothetical protein
MPDDFKGAATPLSDTDINATAANLNCEVAVVEAVCDVESGGGGFLPDGRPKILFEAHAFHNATGAGGTARTPTSARQPGTDRFMERAAHTNMIAWRRRSRWTATPLCKALRGAVFR